MTTRVLLAGVASSESGTNFFGAAAPLGACVAPLFALAALEAPALVFFVEATSLKFAELFLFKAIGENWRQAAKGVKPTAMDRTTSNVVDCAHRSWPCPEWAVVTST